MKKNKYIEKLKLQIRELEQKVVYYRFDSLTSCLLRKDFESTINSYLQNKSIFTIMMFDINNLKAVNTDKGHVAGDIYIVDTLNKVKELLPLTDIYRIGGDEFIIILKHKPTSDVIYNILHQKDICASVEFITGDENYDRNTLVTLLDNGIRNCKRSKLKRRITDK